MRSASTISSAGLSHAGDGDDMEGASYHRLTADATAAPTAEETNPLIGTQNGNSGLDVFRPLAFLFTWKQYAWILVFYGILLALAMAVDVIGRSTVSIAGIALFRWTLLAGIAVASGHAAGIFTKLLVVLARKFLPFEYYHFSTGWQKTLQAMAVLGAVSLSWPVLGAGSRISETSSEIALILKIAAEVLALNLAKTLAMKAYGGRWRTGKLGSALEEAVFWKWCLRRLTLGLRLRSGRAASGAGDAGTSSQGTKYGSRPAGRAAGASGADRFAGSSSTMQEPLFQPQDGSCGFDNGLDSDNDNSGSGAFLSGRQSGHDRELYVQSFTSSSSPSAMAAGVSLRAGGSDDFSLNPPHTAANGANLLTVPAAGMVPRSRAPSSADAMRASFALSSTAPIGAATASATAAGSAYLKQQALADLQCSIACTKIFAACDPQQTGFITAETVRTCLGKKEHAVKALAMLDLDRDSRIGVEDLKAALLMILEHQRYVARSLKAQQDAGDIAQSICNVLFWLAMVVFVISSLGYDVLQLLLPFAGLFFLVSFGLGPILSNAAISINLCLHRKLFDVGDLITIDDGAVPLFVEQIRLWDTMFYTITGQCVYISNPVLATARISNWKRSHEVIVQQHIFVDAKTTTGEQLAMLRAMLADYAVSRGSSVFQLQMSTSSSGAADAKTAGPSAATKVASASSLLSSSSSSPPLSKASSPISALPSHTESQAPALPPVSVRVFGIVSNNASCDEVRPSLDVEIQAFLRLGWHEREVWMQERHSFLLRVQECLRELDIGQL